MIVLQSHAVVVAQWGLIMVQFEDSLRPRSVKFPVAGRFIKVYSKEKIDDLCTHHHHGPIKNTSTYLNVSKKDVDK